MVTEEHPREAPRGSGEVRLRSDYCVFQRGGGTFAIATRVAREVLEWRPFTVLPRAPDGLVGAFNLRGEVIPVTRLDRFLGVPEKPLEWTDSVLVLADAELTLATFVDAVAAVRHIPPWEIQRPDSGERQRNPLLRGTTSKEGLRISILDGERLLAAVATYVASGFHRSGVLTAGMRDHSQASPQDKSPVPGSGGR
jgi:purine-binding chemotaxis protein CheW